MADGKKAPVKKVGTRKMRDGAQQYTSPSMARDPKMIEKLTSKGANPKAVGKAAHAAFMQYGVKDLSTKVTSSYGAKKRVGKPRGGR